jgi:hypothetical protein
MFFESDKKNQPGFLLAGFTGSRFPAGLIRVRK